MPELPEVETMCRCIAAAVGCRIRDVERPKSRLQSILISPQDRPFPPPSRGPADRGRPAASESGCCWCWNADVSPLPTGEGPGVRAVHGSEIANCELRIANCKLSAANPQSLIPNPPVRQPSP